MIPLVTISQEILTLIKLHLPPLTTRAPSKLRLPSSVRFSKNIFSESQKTKYPSPSSDCMMTSSGFSPTPRIDIDSWKRCSSKLKKYFSRRPKVNDGKMGRWKVGGQKWTMERERSKVDYGKWGGQKWTMESGRTKVDDGKWAVKSGLWKVGGKKWTMQSGRSSRSLLLASGFIRLKFCHRKWTI